MFRIFKIHSYSYHRVNFIEGRQFVLSVCFIVYEEEKNTLGLIHF